MLIYIMFQNSVERVPSKLCSISVSGAVFPELYQTTRHGRGHVKEEFNS